MRKYSTAYIIGIVILMAILGFAGLKLYQNHDKSNHRIAVIVHDKKVIERIDLNSVVEPRNIEVSGNYHSNLRVENGRIKFEHADCPDKICVYTGWVMNKGDLAVCIPNKVLVYIEND